MTLSAQCKSVLDLSESKSSTTDFCQPDQNKRFYRETRLLGEFDSTNYCDLENQQDEASTGSVFPQKSPLETPAIITLPTTPCSIHYRQLQLWEGRVDSVDNDFFTATITDRTDPSHPDESVEIDLDELSEADRKRVKLGALFVWSIAYRDAGSGRQTVSEIRFRRNADHLSA